MITHIDIGYNGRLGNQMFNYALLRFLKEKGHDVVIPKRNCTTVKKDGCYDMYHKYWIEYRCVLYDYFNLSIPIVEDEVINKIPIIISESGMNFNPEILNVKEGALRGYFQSYKYFDAIRDIIKSEFQFKSDIVQKVDSQYSINFNDTVCIHIRLGDALAHPNVFKLNSEFISTALGLMGTYIENILVFSDNIEYCRDWFPQDDSIKFIENLNEAESLYLMTKCKHYILSPSTYSWWAVYLGEKQDSKVVFPINWFRDGRNLNDLLLPHWTLL